VLAKGRTQSPVLKNSFQPSRLSRVRLAALAEDSSC
jgi:hypothetical protein